VILHQVLLAMALASTEPNVRLAIYAGIAIFVFFMIVGLAITQRKPARRNPPAAELLDPGRHAGAASHALAEGITRIGRARAGNDIVIPQSTVSGRHAKIVKAGGVWRLRDLKSGNGTFLNGRRLGVEGTPGEMKLTDGDRVRFDIYEFQFHVERALAPAGMTMVRKADPAEAVTMIKPECSNHSGRTAAGQCSRCKQWYCAECLGPAAAAPVCMACRGKGR